MSMSPPAATGTALPSILGVAQALCRHNLHVAKRGSLPLTPAKEYMRLSALDTGDDLWSFRHGMNDFLPQEGGLGMSPFR